MDGLMQRTPLLVTNILDYAAKWHAEQEMVTQTVEGPIHRYTYKESRQRAQLCALALRELGVKPGDRVATMGLSITTKLSKEILRDSYGLNPLRWNTHRHFEAWFGIMGLGCICHTLNPRLFLKDLEFITNDAEDVILMFDSTFLPIIAKLRPLIPTVKHYIIFTDAAHMAKEGPMASVLCYEELLAAQVPHLPGFRWADLDENTACGLCYTSGTTGRPKGVMYSHRSNYLQAFVVALPDATCLTSGSIILPIVPLFHANSWGIVFAAPLAGSRIVFPGPRLDGDSLCTLMKAERVQITAGVPTVCQGMLEHMAKSGVRLPDMKTIVIGGAACPPSMLRAFEEEHGMTVRHLWGMTETSPIGTIGGFKESAKALSPGAQFAVKCRAGRPHILVDMRIVNESGQEAAHDGKAQGALQVRGPHVIQRYYKHEKDAVDGEGWFDTGDIATIDALGHMGIADRSKDVIKSGGEWISSIEVENHAAGHPQVKEAACLGVPHPKWSERPLLVVVKAPRANPSKDDILNFLEGKIAKWWTPDDVAFVDDIPHTAAGKINKLALRQRFKDYKFQTASL